MPALLRQRRHVRWVENGRILKDILNGEQSGKRATGRPMMRYRDVCKSDMKVSDTSNVNWEFQKQRRTNQRGRRQADLTENNTTALTTHSQATRVTSVTSAPTYALASKGSDTYSLVDKGIQISGHPRPTEATLTTMVIKVLLNS